MVKLRFVATKFRIIPMSELSLSSKKREFLSKERYEKNVVIVFVTRRISRDAVRRRKIK